MGLRHSRIDWETVDSYTPEKQKAFFASWAGKFKDECVRDRKIKLAGHLIVERYHDTYEHHLICTEVKRHSIMAMEYSVPRPTAGEAFGSLGNPENLGRICETELTFEELKNMKVRKRVWPEKLRRYGAKAAVKRAKDKEGEQNYSLLTNNCEHFVVWCICGLPVSLQLKTWHTWAKQFLDWLSSTIRVWLIQLVFDKGFVMIFKQCEKYGFVIGSAFTAIFEILYCCYEVKKAFTNKESEGNSTDRGGQLVEIIAKTWFQWNLGIAGIFVGSSYGFICSLGGCSFGIFFGNCLAAIAKWYVESEPFASNAIVVIVEVFKIGFLSSILWSLHQHGA